MVKYASNLDSDSEGLGTVTHSSRFMAAVNLAESTTDTLTSLYDENGNDLGIRLGDVITIQVSDPANPAAPITERFTVVQAPAGAGEIATIEDMRAAIEFVIDQTTDVDVVITADGQFEINTFLSGDPVNNLQITSNRRQAVSGSRTAIMNSVPTSGIRIAISSQGSCRILFMAASPGGVSQ